MNYGFLIRNDRCIGCHACSTACKSENEVALGVNRTWVKYVETGEYPNATRHFQVTRCNHCANPPCVRICPVTAMYQRDDGIVEFDPDVCIGCKACLQACPYDAIYVDPDTGSAAKCHYCAHRVDVGMEPACVVVCPEHAIIAGDMDDPTSEISKMLAENQVTVRRPEQGTSPKLFYVDGEETALSPTATERTPETFMWADVLSLHEGQSHGGDGHASGDGHHHDELSISVGRSTKKSDSGAPLRAPQPQGVPSAGPITIGQGTMANHMVQVGYNAQHKIPWHWPVPAYLVTKGVAAGLFLLAALGTLMGIAPVAGLSAVYMGGLSVVMSLATTALLVYDLEHPTRFLRILTRPQWRSWLVRGAMFLISFSTLSGLWWALEAGALLGLTPDTWMGAAPWLLGLGIIPAVGAAVYTAFLFGQAEGRDLWQSTLLPIHLIVQAALSGGAAALVLHGLVDLGSDMAQLATWTLVGAILADLLVTFLGEFGMPHASDTAARAAHLITHGRYRNHFWWGSLVGGHLLPLAFVWIGGDLSLAAAGAAALVGLYLYEYAFVMAPQEIPNS